MEAYTKGKKPFGGEENPIAEFGDGVADSAGALMSGGFQARTGTGEKRWVDFSVGAMELDGKPSALGTAFDITDRKGSEDRLDHLAHYDFLTGLPNRLLFYEQLADALHGASNLGDSAGLLFIDLDRFKDVNDTLGHDMGDLVLQGVSRRVLKCIGPGGMAARTGSDEFAVLLRNLEGPNEAEAAARKLLEELAHPFTVAGHEVHITASVGICLYPSDGTDLETLMRNADIAMDDFGTGYSSLSYLNKFPIQQLKIDHSFVHDVPEDADDAAIVRAVVTMGHALGILVDAEGVETVGQFDFLREVGCDAVQGFYFKEPQPAEFWTRDVLDW